jgi:hypothetical protein
VNEGKAPETGILKDLIALARKCRDAKEFESRWTNQAR